MADTIKSVGLGALTTHVGEDGLRTSKKLGTTTVAATLFGQPVTEMAEGIKQSALAKSLKLKNKSEKAQEQVKAAHELKSKFVEFRKVYEAMRGQVYSSLTSRGAFYKREAIASLASGEMITVTPEVREPDISIMPPVPIGELNLRVRQLATTDALIGAQHATKNTALGVVGNLTFGLSGATPTTLAFDPSWTLDQVAARINSYSSTTKVNAQIITTGSGYRLELRGAESGKALIVSKAAFVDPTSLVPVTEATADAALGRRIHAGSAAATVQGVSGDINIQAADGIVQTVNITAGMTLNQIRDQINTFQGTTKVVASVVEDPDGTYYLKLAAQNVDQEITLTPQMGFSDPNNVMPSQPATAFEIRDINLMAEFDYVSTSSGGANNTQSYRRSTNFVTDFLPNLALRLNAADVNSVTTVSIKPAFEAITQAVENFVTKFNEMRDLLNFHLTPPQDLEPDENGKQPFNLYGQSFVRQMDRALRESMISPLGLSNVEGEANTLMDVGLTVTSSQFATSGESVNMISRGGKLEFNPTKFVVELMDNFSRVQSLFDLNYSFDPMLDQNFILTRPGAYWNGNPVIVTLNRGVNGGGGEPQFTATIEVAGHPPVTAFVAYDAALDNITIKAQDGSIFQGLNLAYPRTLAEGMAESSTTTASIQNSAGSVYQLMSTLKSFSSSTNNTFDVFTEGLGSEETRRQEMIQRNEERAQMLYERAIETFSRIADVIRELEQIEEGVMNMLNMGSRR